jgi:hypothetical protein
MRTGIGKTLCAALAALPLAACHSSHHSDGGTPPTQPVTYGAALTGIDVERTADQQALPVAGIPAQGATLTVR